LPPRCVDLSSDQVVAALRSVASMRALLQHMAAAARPGEGAPKILVPIARMASSACDWVDGGLHVEVVTVPKGTQILVAIDLGGGVRELLFPRLFLAVEREELVRAVKLAPVLVAPMTVRFKQESLVLTCEVDRVGTIAPPAFDIAEESLRRSLSAALRRSLPPIGATSNGLSAERPVDAVVLARIIPKAPRAPVVDELTGLDVGWDFGAYSSTVNTRETKPPPEPRPLSTAPTRPPPKASTRPPPRASRAPRARAPSAPAPQAKPPAVPRPAVPRPAEKARPTAKAPPPTGPGATGKRPAIRRASKRPAASKK
jgi:hypothetical protein